MQSQAERRYFKSYLTYTSDLLGGNDSLDLPNIRGSYVRFLLSTWFGESKSTSIPVGVDIPVVICYLMSSQLFFTVCIFLIDVWDQTERSAAPSFLGVVVHDESYETWSVNNAKTNILPSQGQFQQQNNSNTSVYWAAVEPVIILPINVFSA